MTTLVVLSACLPDTFTADELEQIDTLRFDPESLPPWEHVDVDEELAAVLGQSIYADKGFSVDGSVSCLTCHDLLAEGASGIDPLRGEVSEGAGGFTNRNAPTILEVAYRNRWGWVGQFCTLHEMNVFPLTSETVYGHLDGTAEITLADKVRNGSIAALWAEVFGPDLTYDADVVQDMGIALEAFERTVRPSTIPLDLFFAGEEHALRPAELRGLALFVGKGHCIDCHSGPLLSDGALHVTALAGADLGANPPKGAFVTPPLRNVARTAPYMHDGSLPTLEDVVWHYDIGGDSQGETAGIPDPMIKPLLLDAEERADLAAFLGSLGPT